MNAQRRNDVSIYCLSNGPSLPEWLGDQAKRNLSKRDESIRRRIELLQDFQMPSSSSKLMQSLDGRYITVAGSYPPRIRCYDVHELSLKFERYLNAECIDMLMLSEDYGKMALLLDDRTISFHAPYGAHHSIRIPTFGRAMAYEPTTCELLIAAKGNNVYRVNLEEGRFNEPWNLEDSNKNSSSGFTVSGTSIAVNPLHPLATVGCDDGIVRFWDSRSHEDVKLTPFLKLDVHSATTGYGYSDPDDYKYNTSYSPSEITCMSHDPSGLYMAFGTASGVVALYDVRSSRPLHIQEHKHGLPIHTVRFHPGSGMVLSSDEKLIKVWRYKSLNLSSFDKDMIIDPLSGNNNENSDIGSVKVNIEGVGKSSHFIVAGDANDPYGYRSGVIMCTTDQPKMDTYYIPAVGVAPKWCSFLENITEELEEKDLQRDGTNADGVVSGKNQETVFENYKFVSRDELEKLGISNLIGTPLLRGYMHGFFMDINLYNRVKAVADPFEYEEYQKKKLKERLEAKRASRITPRQTEKNSKKKASKTVVNPDLAERLQSKAKSSTKSGQFASSLLGDDRFGTLFTNPDFAINEEDENFKLRNPSGVAAAKYKKNNLDSDSDDDEDVDDEHAENDNEGGDSSNEGEDDNDISESDDSDLDIVKVRGEAYEEVRALVRQQKRQKKEIKNEIIPKAVPKLVDDSVNDEIDDNGVVNIVLGDKTAAEQFKKRREELNMPIGRRFALQQEKNEDNRELQVRTAPGGSKEATFIPKSAKRKQEQQDRGHTEIRGERNRRGVKGLGLSKPFKTVRSKR